MKLDAKHLIENTVTSFKRRQNSFSVKMNLKPGEINLGTTVMAVKYANGVIMGADTRTSSGIFVVNRASDKLTPLSKSIYCCRSGSAADTQALAAMVRSQLESHSVQLGRAPTVKTAATLFQRLCYENKDKLSASILVAGFDEINGGVVYSLPLGGALVQQNYAISGSGSTFIYGFCDANYRENMSEEEALKFVKNAIAHSMHRDGSSGGNIRTLVLKSLDKPVRSFTRGDELPYPPNASNQI